MPHVQGSGDFPKVKACLALLAVVLATYILGPPLYWHFFEGVAFARHKVVGSNCPPCLCDCDSRSDNVLPPGFSTGSEGCTDPNPQMQNELNKHSVDLLSEELKLQSVVADENQRRSDKALLDVKKLSSQYQKEAEKCNFGMETCEEAREKAEAALAMQKKLAKLWEQRARQLGWKND